MDYMNPGSGLPEQGQRVEQLGFWPGVNQGLGQQIMAPVRDNANAMRDLELQKARANFAEEQAPAAIAGRQQAIVAKMATDTGTIATQPSLTADQVAGHEAHLKLIPAENKAAIEAASQAYNKSRGTPQQAVYDGLSDMAPEINSAPPGMKPILWMSKIAELQHLYPDSEIPEDMKQWSPENETQIQHNYMGRVHSVADTQKKEESRAAKESAITVEEMRAKASLDAARIHAGGMIGAANVRATIEKPKNMSQTQAEYTRRLAKDPNDAEAKNGMQSIVSEKLAKDPVYSNLAGMYSLKVSTGDTAGATKLKTAMDNVESQFNQRHGLGGPTTPTSDPRSDAMSAISRGADKGAVAQRYKQMTGKDL